MAEEATKNSGGRLEPTEIDTLLAPRAEADAGGVVTADPTASVGKIAAYDFRNPAFLSEAELRRLRLTHEDFTRYLSARLALQLRMEFGVKLAKLATVTYSTFTDLLPNPTHLGLFKLEPLAGIGVLGISPRLALTIVDRLLGGKGQSVKTERYLTEIEIALLEDVTLSLLEEWCGQWKAEQELKPAMAGHENNGRFLQTSSRDAIVLAITLECTFGDCAEQIQLGVPYATIEPLMKKMAGPPAQGCGGGAGGEARDVAGRLRSHRRAGPGRVGCVRSQPARDHLSAGRRRARAAGVALR